MTAKKAIRTVSVALAAIFTITTFSCFSHFGANDGVITVSIGGGGSESPPRGNITQLSSISSFSELPSWPPTQQDISRMDFKITLQGSSGTITHNLDKGQTTASFSVTPGDWRVTVDAYINGAHYATGSGGKEVIAGQPNSVVISMLPVTQDGSEAFPFIVTNEAHWNAARTAIANGTDITEYYINIEGFVTVAGSTEPTFGDVRTDGFTVNISGGTLKLRSNGNLLRIIGTQAVHVRNTALVGRRVSNDDGNNNASLIYIVGSDFTMKGSASVSGNSNEGTGGGVYLHSGTFHMYDTASVYDNRADTFSYSYGGGVVVTMGALFTMNDNASVSGNYSNSYGGGVAVGDNGTIVMNGGTIKGNNAYTNGGGVFVGSSGNFAMINGTVYGSSTHAPSGFFNQATTSNAALHIDGSGVARYGATLPITTPASTWGNGNLLATDGTIEVVDGTLL